MNMKKIIFLTLFVLLAAFAFIKVAETKNKSYYSGDAISYNGTVYIGSTNSGYLEVFKLNGNDLEEVARIKRYDGRFNSYENFYDLQFTVEGNKLYVYTISHYTIYKYQVLGSRLELVAENTNTYWEWYNGLETFAGQLATISAKGTKVWNKDLQVIVSYPVSNEKSPYSISGQERFIANVDGNYLEIFDREANREVSRTALNFKEINNHKVYQDIDGAFYVVDDYFAKKYNSAGKLLVSFKHIEQPGFDMAGTGNDFIYFSNGMGVVKLNKTDMSLADYAYTYRLGGPNGWAMGLEVVNNNGKDYVVIFNNSNILVLDNKLEKLASLIATEKEEPYSQENLYLALDHYKATKAAVIELHGGGYVPNENLSINFAGTITELKADARGRFKTSLIVPDKKGLVDIKVDGKDSKLSYSTSFDIKESND